MHFVIFQALTAVWPDTCVFQSVGQSRLEKSPTFPKTVMPCRKCNVTGSVISGAVLPDAVLSDTILREAVLSE